MKTFIDKRIKVIKSIPLYAWLISLLFFGLQFFFYYISKVIINSTGGISRCWTPILPGDNNIPLLPIFILPYAWSWIYWMFGGCSAYLTNKEHFVDWIITISAAYLIGFIIFNGAPTFMDRSKDIWIQEAMNKKGLLYDCWRLIVANDGGDVNLNLFPSYHCLISTCCFFATHRQKNISLSYRIYSLIILILICLSTVFTKQHYYLDIIGGVGIASICYFIVYLIKPGKKILEHHYINKRAREILNSNN